LVGQAVAVSGCDGWSAVCTAHQNKTFLSALAFWRIRTHLDTINEDYESNC